MSPMKWMLKKGDTVEILAGDERGEKGKIKLVDRKRNVVIVERRNMVKRHSKPSQSNPNGGIIEKEAPIHVSNVRLVRK